MQSLSSIILLSFINHGQCLQCLYDDNQYASFSDQNAPMTFTDTLLATYVQLGYVKDPVLVSKVETCADYENDGELSFSDVIKLTYVYLGYLTPPSHFFEAVERDSLLLFSATKVFRHSSIEYGVAAIKAMMRPYYRVVDAHEDSEEFRSSYNLLKYKCIIFLSTTGNVLNEKQERNFESFMKLGGSFVGIHAATDTEYDWSYYGSLVGAYFSGHPAQQNVSVKLTNANHPINSNSNIPVPWIIFIEPYNFNRVPADKTILLALDESTYTGGTMGDNHPISWCSEKTNNMGRMYYNGMGHREDIFDNSVYMQHLKHGIMWASNYELQSPSPPPPPPMPFAPVMTGYEIVEFFGYNETTFPLSWSYENKIMCTLTSSDSRPRKDLLSMKSYSGSWSFWIENRVPRPGNSGLYYFMKTGESNPWSAAPEMQVAGPDHGNQNTDEQSFGALYYKVAPTTYPEYPGRINDWNVLEVSYNHQTHIVTHSINGVNVVTYSQLDHSWGSDEGHIFLQHHGEYDVCYRNAQIKMM